MLTRPIAPVVGLRTNGHSVNQVQVRCVYCSGVHTHEWFDEPDGLRQPTCGALGSYTIAITTQARIDHMRSEYPAPDGTVALVPLHIGYAYERDGNDDIIGVVAETTLGSFVLWLGADTAVQLAGQLVEIVENREMLREKYLQRAETGQPIASGATKVAEVV